MIARSRKLAAGLVLLAAAASMPGQTAWVLTRDVSAGTSPAFATWLPDAAYHGGNFAPAWAALPLPNFVAGISAATGTPTPPVAHEGGLAVDVVAGIVYSTDGTSFLSQDALQGHAGAPAPAPTAVLPLVSGPMGPITGLAVDPDSGFLWICDSMTFQARSKIFPYPVVGPVLPIPPFIGVPGATGLGFDPSTAHLWATNVNGATVEFTMAGGLVSTHPPIAPAHGPIRGLDINPGNGAGSFPPYPGQAGGFHVCVTDGEKIFDALPPHASILTLASVPSHTRGLAIGAAPSQLPGRHDGIAYRFQNDRTLDPGPAFAWPKCELTRPSHDGASPTPCAVRLEGGPAGSAVLLLADLQPLAVAAPTPGVIVGTTVLWINPFSPTYAILPAFTDPTGTAAITLPIGIAPAGLQFVLQWAVPEAGAYLGLRFSDAIQVKVTAR